MEEKSKRHEPLSEIESIAKTKQEVIDFYSLTGMKTAACNFVGRDIVTINKWEAADSAFKASLLKARAEYARDSIRRVMLDNQFANLYLEDFKPEVEQTVTDSQELQLPRKILNPEAKPHQPLPPEQQTD